MTRVTLSPSPGPERAPAAAAGAGLLTDSPLRASWPASVAVLDRTVLREESIVLGEDDELRYAVLPAFDHSAQIVDAFRASAIAVDLLFDDGTRLLAADPADQYGLPASARASLERAALTPDQWNLRRLPLAAHAGRRVVAIEVVVDAPAPVGPTSGELSTWIDGVAIVPARRLPVDASPAELVLTTRGTQSSPTASRGNTMPFAGLPHGFTLVTPMTDTANAHWNYAWNQHSEHGRLPRLRGLAISHTPSLWVGDRGVLLLSASPGPREPDPAGTAFDHDDESARPHRYGVRLADGTAAEVAATDHGAIFRFELGAGTAEARLMFDRLDGGAYVLDPGTPQAVRGHVDSRGPHTTRLPRLYFDAVVSGRTEEASVVPGIGGAPDSAVLRVRPDADGAITVRVGTSWIGAEEARAARETELPPSRGIDDVATSAKRAWNALLSRVRVEGATDDQLVTLYSNLYRLFLYPTALTEGSGPHERYASPFIDAAEEDGPDHSRSAVRSGRMYANNGFWDTYRTSWPGYLLFAPDRVGDLLDGFLQHYRDGGWTARWSAPGYLDAMVGTSFDVISADAVTKHAPGFDAAEAYDAALRNATVHPPSRFTGRKGLRSTLYRGYVANDLDEGLSWTVEGAINDFGLWVQATALARLAPTGSGRRSRLDAEARYFHSRALAYRRLFDPATGFLRSRTPDGDWEEPFDPAVWGGGYTETNAWGMAVSAPHDGAGLAHLHGGPQGLARLLDAYFSTPETAREELRGTYPSVIHEMTEARDIRLGMFGLSNQPAHHVPYMYAFAGAPHRLQALVRESLARLFTGSEIGQGYPGDEDNGEMSAWWLFSAMGLYPLAPGSGEYVVGSPLFPRLTVDIPGAGTLEIVAENQAPENVYVQSLTLDGEPWESLAIPHARIARDARLVFTMGPEPSAWGASPEARPSSLSDHDLPLLDDALRDARVASGAGPAAAALTDDIGATTVELAAGACVTWELREAAAPELTTLTLAEPGRYAWRLERSADGTAWSVADERDEEYAWAHQLRVFALATPSTPARWWRLTALTPLPLEQVELLTPSADPLP
ncbi:GH92 family glycosyl hydrolase [Leifsonia shinshuensis]|uniref:GH92 family glycosyl hydrolase n=1 Tax=Leifsonia shinshuensis TaxID=150026 RepID=UPI001F509065|nr:GH92 family glycosyl hydrolase [Leifsonia shinshuensis]MCI0156397.1 GH92 family glycosyl hydrolase [Leifsonia shinshuensis]